MAKSRRVLLVDPISESRESLSVRLETLGYEVTVASDGAQGAYLALESPPHAVIADLFMPSISGAQLCRLLNAEVATAHVPVILRGPDVHRNRFWAEQTGALAYVIKGRMGELVRALERGVAQSSSEDGFFTALAVSGSDVRDRIAHYLDAALFASVVAAEVRNLAVCENFDRLFDLLSQFVSQVTNYRWLSVVTERPDRGGLHVNAKWTKEGQEEATRALGLDQETPLLVIADDDAIEQPAGPAPLVRSIQFGNLRLGSIAIAFRDPPNDQDVELLEILAREIGGPLRTSALVEESHRLAQIDPLTGMFNRRAFMEVGTREVERCHRHADPLSVILLDVDHFKKINDSYGHGIGDRCLAAVAKCIRSQVRSPEVAARWGGEEFVILLPGVDHEDARNTAERLRESLLALEVHADNGAPVLITASLGVAGLLPADNLEGVIDHADQAMYVAKSKGRNRVVVAAREALVGLVINNSLSPANNREEVA